jgi:hypothetical protein
MKKLIISTILATTIINASDVDLEALIINNTTTKLVINSSANIGEIFSYIKKYRVYISDYSLARIDSRISSYRVNNHYNRSSNVTSYSENVGQERIQVELNYPLYDPKSRKDMVNNKLRDNQSILRYINTYFKAIDNNIANRNTIKFYKEKLQEEQSKPKNSKGYISVQFNGKTIIQSNEIYYAEQILSSKNKIISDIDIIIAKEQLLNLVKDNHKHQLSNLLKN